MAESIKIVGVGLESAHALDVRDSDRLWRYYHEHYCVTLLHHGHAEWRYRGNDAVATPDTLMLMEPGEVHVATKVAVPGSFFAVFVSKEHLGRMMGDEVGIEPHFALQSLASPACVERMQMLYAATQWGEKPAQEEQLCMIYADVLAAAGEAPRRVPANAQSRVRRGAALLEERYREMPKKTVVIQEIAAELNMSYHWFVHSFRNEFGLPPYRFVQSLRLAHARRLMAKGPNDELRSVKDVATAAGYVDAPHMARDFRRVKGLPPRAWARVLNPGWA